MVSPIYKTVLTLGLVFLVSCGTKDDKDPQDSQVGPVRPAVNSDLACASRTPLLSAGESFQLAYTFKSSPVSSVQFEKNIDDKPSLYFSDTGTLSPDPSNPLAVNYTVPAVAPTFKKLGIRAVSSDLVGECPIYYLLSGKKATLLDPDEPGPFNALVANIYDLSSVTINTAATPPVNLDTLPVLERSLLKNIDFQSQLASEKMRGLTSRSKLFAVRIEGRLRVPPSTSNPPLINMNYGFKVEAQSTDSTQLDYDRALLYIDGQLVVSTPQIADAPKLLTAGDHVFKLEYYYLKSGADPASERTTLILKWGFGNTRTTLAPDRFIP